MSVSTWVTIESSLMIGKSRVACPVRRAGVAGAEFPTGTRSRPQSAPRFDSGGDRAQLPLPPRSACAGRTRRTASDSARLATHLSPEAPSGKTPAPTSQLSTTAPAPFRKTLAESRRLPELRASPGRRLPRTRSDRRKPGRSRARAIALTRSPTGSRPASRACGSRAAYMPAREADREGQDLQFAGIVGLARGARAAGKMCKVRNRRVPMVS